jgi:hypothetical protein
MRDGHHIADAAHFYPNRSFWAEMDPSDNDKARSCGAASTAAGGC